MMRRSSVKNTFSKTNVVAIDRRRLSRADRATLAAGATPGEAARFESPEFLEPRFGGSAGLGAIASRGRTRRTRFAIPPKPTVSLTEPGCRLRSARGQHRPTTTATGPSSFSR